MGGPGSVGALRVLADRIRIDVDERTCAWCGVDISAMSQRARYCNRQHKKNAASKRHRERNPGYYKRYHGSPARVTWLEANREAVRAYAREQQRAYRVAHPDAGRAWWAANAERHRLYQAERRARQLGNRDSLPVPPKEIRRLINRHQGCCAYCGDRPASLDIDHVIPLARGGRHAIGNLVPACPSCNRSKRDLLLVEWKRRQARVAA